LVLAAAALNRVQAWFTARSVPRPCPSLRRQCAPWTSEARPEYRVALSRALKGKKHKPRATINKEIADQYVANPTEVARPV